ncbi:hypothetical protein ACEPPN_017240 [Leptodophora sp. 'Broadleaf-Isolate-01']
MPSYPPNLPTYEDESQRVVRRRLSLSATGDEEEEEALAHTLPSKRQRSPETSGSWANSPMLSLLVGPERKLFQIHKEMLFQAAHYFTTIFNNTNDTKTNMQTQTQTQSFSSEYLSLTNANTATFPTDDPTAFELLIQWCYTGKLPSLTRQAQDSVFNIEVTKFCSVRLRLCCLADKYGMVLLHNLAMDSILAFLGSGSACSRSDDDCNEKGKRKGKGKVRGKMEMEMEMGLEWKVFKGWCRYVYEHSSEHSSLRRFITAYFNYAIRSQKSESKTQTQNSNPSQNPNQNSTGSGGMSKAEGTKTSESGSGYAIEKLHALANDIPGLMKDLFAFMRVQAFVPRPISRPWDCNPCDFHIHTSRSSSHLSSSSPSSSVSSNNIKVACPMSLVPPLSTWPSPAAKIQYFLQDATLKGTVTCYVSQVVDELGFEREVLLDALRELVDGDVVVWVDFGQSFKLDMPRVKEEGEMREIERGKEQCVVPEVRIFEPEEVEDLYSANAGF